MSKNKGELERSKGGRRDRKGEEREKGETEGGSTSYVVSDFTGEECRTCCWWFSNTTADITTCTHRVILHMCIHVCTCTCICSPHAYTQGLKM